MEVLIALAVGIPVGWVFLWWLNSILLWTLHQGKSPENKWLAFLLGPVFSLFLIFVADREPEERR